jgi:molybdate transport system substrate-binding protein
VVSTIGFLTLMVLSFVTGCTKGDSKERGGRDKADSLFVLSGAGLKCVLDPLAEAFTKETGIGVEYSYLCSAMLLTNLELTRQGDVFVPGSKYYFNLARKKGLVDEDHMVIGGYMVPCIMVQEGNPKNIQNLEDLLKPGMRLGVGDFKALAVGRLSEVMLKRAGIFDPFMENVEVIGGSATKMCLPVCMNSIDALINWAGTAKTFDHCSDMVLIDKERVMYSTFPVALTKYAGKEGDAMKYFEFVQSQKAGEIFEKHGFGIYFDPKPEQYVE